MPPPHEEIRELRAALIVVRETIAGHSTQLSNGARFREDLDAMKELRCGPRLAGLEVQMTEVSEALIGQSHALQTLTASQSLARVDQERRHEEVIDAMKEDRQARTDLAVASVAADASKWDALKDPKVLVLSAVIIIAVLAPEALPYLFQAIGGAADAPAAIEAPALP